MCVCACVRVCVCGMRVHAESAVYAVQVEINGKRTPDNVPNALSKWTCSIQIKTTAHWY